MSEPRPLSAVSAIAWPAVPGPAGAAMLALQWQLENGLRADPAERQRARLGQLRAIASHAAAHVPWYGTRAAEAAATLTWERFREWPLLRAEDVRADAQAFYATTYPREHGRLVESRTSGSTGQPLRIFNTEASQFLGHGMLVRDHLWHGRDLDATLGATLGRTQRTRQAGWGLINGVFRTGPGVSIGAAEGVDAQLDWLLAERPHYLHAHAANLRALVLRSRETGRRPSGLRQLLSQGGMLPPDLRALAREAWGVEVVDAYSCEEFGLIASQCPRGEHYHVHEEHVVLEVLREDGTACEPGERGRVTLSTLNNFAMPLLRYQIGDYAEAGGACDAGLPLPVLSRIAGRARNMLRDPTGRRTFPAIPAKVWIDVAPIQQFRLVQTELARIEVRYVMARELSAYERSVLAAELSKAFGYPYEFGFVRRDRFERDPGGKYEDFVSLLPEDA